MTADRELWELSNLSPFLAQNTILRVRFVLAKIFTQKLFKIVILISIIKIQF